MRITELFTAQSIALDEAQQDRSQIIDRLVELQATHGNIRDKEAYKKGLYEREDEGSTYVDNGITVPHAKCDCVTRPSLAALRLKTPVQYNAEDDGKTDLLFAIAAPKNGSLHVDMLARMMQMLMNEDFVEKLRTAKTPENFLAAIDAQEEAQFGDESFTDQEIEQAGYRVLAVTACVNGIAHTYMAAEALNKAGAKMGVTIKVETNGSDGAKNLLTKDEIANCDGIIVAAEKKIETARFDGKPVLFTRVDDGIHKPEELIHKITSGEVPEFHAKGGAQAAEDASASDSFGRSLYKNLMNGAALRGGRRHHDSAGLPAGRLQHQSLQLRHEHPAGRLLQDGGFCGLQLYAPHPGGLHRHVHRRPSGSGCRFRRRRAGHERHQLRRYRRW